MHHALEHRLRKQPSLLVRMRNRLPGFEPVAEGMSLNRLNRISEAMQRLIDGEQLAGTTTMVIRNGTVVHWSSAGYQDRERKILMRDDTIYRIYSMTKPITAVATLMLAEEGRLLLEDPISRYLPAFANPVVQRKHPETGTEIARPITIRHLLTHTSGISYSFIPSAVTSLYEEANISAILPNKSHASLEVLVDAIARMPLVSQPGTEWHYGMSTDVLGRIIEVLSGQDLRAFFRERIFEPLEMIDTDFFVPPEKLGRFAATYKQDDDGSLQLNDDPQTSEYRSRPDICLGGSGLVGTAWDYARFAQLLLNGGVLGGQRLLSPGSVRLMLTSQLPAGLPTETFAGDVVPMSYGDDWGMGFGLGGFVLVAPEKTGIPASPGCYGWAGAAGTNFWIDPQLNLTGIVMTQLMPGHAPVRETMQSMTYQAVIRE